MIYFVQRKGGLVKIGRTRDFQTRIVALTRQYGELNVLCTHAGDAKVERCFHKRYKEYHIQQEWFALPPPEIEYIKNHIDEVYVEFEQAMKVQVSKRAREYREKTGITAEQKDQQQILRRMIRRCKAVVRDDNGKVYSFDKLIWEMDNEAISDVLRHYSDERLAWFLKAVAIK